MNRRTCSSKRNTSNINMSASVNTYWVVIQGVSLKSHGDTAMWKGSGAGKVGGGGGSGVMGGCLTSFRLRASS